MLLLVFDVMMFGVEWRRSRSLQTLEAPPMRARSSDSKVLRMKNK
jgi:hypothetical protein